MQMPTQAEIAKMTPVELASVVEAGLGENLVWLDDALDLRVRQRDPETVKRLEQLNLAWIAAARLKHALRNPK